jgi:hypothetical protein
MKYRIAITTIVTFLLFLTEALIHYNIGKNSNNNTGEPIVTTYPSFNEFVCIAGTVLFFSLVSGYVSNCIIWYIDKRNK